MPERDAYKAVTAGVETALAQARPGMKASEVYRLVVSAVRTAGLSRFAHPHVGHGIGVEARDIPLLAPRQADRISFIDGEFDPALEVGMVINVETPLSLMGEGGYQHEITFWVGERGNELLTPLHPYYVARQ